ELSGVQLDAAGIVAAYALADLGPDSMANADELAEHAGELLAKDLLGEQPAHPRTADSEDAS
ncbi:glycerate kinase, partial [Embleya sp. NPDC059259]